MTISQIKKLTAETEPYYFARKTMRWWGQRMSDFRVSKCEDGRYLVQAPSKHGMCIRYFNPSNNKLELK
jgi:hypothetical protein